MTVLSCSPAHRSGRRSGAVAKELAWAAPVDVSVQWIYLQGGERLAGSEERFTSFTWQALRALAFVT